MTTDAPEKPYLNVQRLIKEIELREEFRTSRENSLLDQVNRKHSRLGDTATLLFPALITASMDNMPMQGIVNLMLKALLLKQTSGRYWHTQRQDVVLVVRHQTTFGQRSIRATPRATPNFPQVLKAASKAPRQANPHRAIHCNTAHLRHQAHVLLHSSARMVVMAFPIALTLVLCFKQAATPRHQALQSLPDQHASYPTPHAGLHASRFGGQQQLAASRFDSFVHCWMLPSCVFVGGHISVYVAPARMAYTDT